MKSRKVLSMVMALLMVMTTFTLSGAVTSSAEPGNSPFTDVAKDAWYYDAVVYVNENGLMNGTGGTTFAPGMEMSRAMFITVMGRLCGAESSAKDTFADTDKNTWYSSYVGWANENGIMTGYNGLFRPNDPITRQEAAVCVSRLITYLDAMFDYTNISPDDYVDTDKIAADWALSHVQSLSRYGVIKGDQNGNFKPTDLLDRAQGATILMRLHKKYLDATNTALVLNVWDFFNKPEQLLTNMLSEKNVSTSLPSMGLKSCDSDAAPWYFGVNFNYSDIPAGGLEYVKFVFKTDDMANDIYLQLSSPVYTSKLTPVSKNTEGDYTAVIFKTGDEMRTVRGKIFTDHESYFDTAEDSSLKVDYPTYNSRYLRVALYPFGTAADVTANVSYVGFFSNEADAKAYTSASDSNRFTDGEDVYAEADIRELTDGILTQYESAMNDRIEEIKNTPNTFTPADIKGKCYYVSSINGKEGNDGLSPETPFASPMDLYKVYQPGFSISILKAGDAVFFERGSVFYKVFGSNYSGDTVLNTVAGVTYTTYGEGEKPIFAGCLDIEGSMNWVDTGYKNVWKLSEPITLVNSDDPGDRADVGNIIFTDKNGKIGWGIMVFAANDASNSFDEGTMSVDNAIVTNGYEVYDSYARELKDPSALKNNLEFFHDWDTNTLYLYYDKGNPGEEFECINVSTRGVGINAGDDCIIDNISIKYTGGHGINAGVNNCTIQNCTLEWIGGSHQGSGTVRFGNGIEIYGSSEGYTITNCYVNQVYDGGISTQISTADNVLAIQNNLEFSNNVITNTNSHIEIWNYGVGSVLSNIRLTGNYLAVGGYHFGHQRPNKGGSLIYLGRFAGQEYNNSLIEDNVIMFAHSLFCGRPLLARGESNGTIVRNNVFISSTKTRLGEFQADWHNDYIGGDAIEHAQMYTEENIRAMVDAGIGEGCIFYITDDFYDEREAEGLFYNRGKSWRD